MPEFSVLDSYCIECDDPLEDDGEKHEHPFYSNEAICQHCHDKISSMSFQEFEDSPVDIGHPIDWMVDETDEEYFDHEA